MHIAKWLAVSSVAVLVSCSSSGSSDPKTHTVGGNVTGLAGSGLVLRNNGTSDLAIAANGTFTFGTALASGATYAVTVASQPTSPAQICTVANGAGTMGNADVTTVSVACATTSHSIGGTVAGLVGSGLVLQNDAGDNLEVSANGTFTFATAVSSGSPYTVTVLTQPGSPTQICSVANGVGIVGGANVSDVSVVCASQAYTVGGAASGLSGSGLTLRNNGGDALSISANGPFTFSAPVASGATYAVTVATQPSSPTQVCTVVNATGTVGGSNVTSVAVTCVASSFTVGGSVTGLASGASLVLRNNGTNDLPIGTNGPFAFTARIASGSPYAVTVATQPTTPPQACTVSFGAGTVASANVTNVVVTCVTGAYLVGGTVTGLDGTGLVLRNNGGDDLSVAASGSFTFSTPAVSGSPYAVTVVSQPSAPAQTCAVANGTGTVASANVTNVRVTCPPAVVLQKWRAPAAWGGTTSFWSDNDPGLVEHLMFNPVPQEWSHIRWTAPNGAPNTNNALTGVGSAGVTRYGAGPFDVAATGSRYVADQGDEVLDIQGDVLVCAVVKPDWNPVTTPADDRIIMAKGERGAGGWVLMQSGVQFAFRYQSSTGEKGASTDTDLAMPLGNPQGPLNPSYLVVCGGRDVAGGKVVAAVNGWSSSATAAVAVTETMVTSLLNGSVGGYAVNDLRHDYGGRIYETAVWRIPATRANIEAKMAPVLGLFMPDGTTPVSYTRDREGYYVGVGAGSPYHTAWKHQPRIDPTGKGFLFGLQASNRVRYPEALQLWSRTPAGGAGVPVVTPNDALPPGDANIQNAARILLPAGSSLSLPLTAFGNAGAAHGQIWVRAVGTQTGTLTVASAIPSTNPPTSLGSQAIPLATLTTWTNVSLIGLDAAPPTSLGTVYLRNDGGDAIEFHAWGVVLTQLGRETAAGGATVLPLGFDPGPTIYDSLVSPSSREVLTLPPLNPSTTSSGFCIGAEAQPPTGMTWQGPFLDPRTLVGWSNPAGTQMARIRVTGAADGHLLEMLFEGISSGYVRAAFSVAIDSSARVKGCVAPSGAMTLYVDDVALVPSSTQALTAAPPDLIGGSLAVGSNHAGSEPWQGYVKAAVACRLSGNVSECQ